MHWHSDWSGRKCDPVAMVAISICVEDQDPARAPMMVIPTDKTQCFAGCSGSGAAPLPSELSEAVRLCPKAGHVVVRNVVAWHGGTANDTSSVRYLPAVRICFPAAWEDGSWWGPRRVLPASFKHKYSLSERWRGVVQKPAPARATSPRDVVVDGQWLLLDSPPEGGEWQLL